MWRPIVASLVALGALVIPTAALAVVPVNDDYLKSFPINRPDTRVSREDFKASVDTTEATTQADLFLPGTVAGGGPENTTCQGKAFGKTVWYDLHPDVDGALEIQTGGFNVAINVYEFDNRTAKILRAVDCAADPGTQDFIPRARLKAKRHYTIQVGGIDDGAGAGPLGGVLDISFQFFADRDDDDVFDPLDSCPDQPGIREAGGCPPELRSTPKLTATPTATGIIVRKLSVSAPKGAKVEVRCRRRCSGHQARTAGVVSFPLLRGRALPAGAVVEIFVTKPKAIGTYVRYDIVRGNFKRVDRCLRPGSHAPRKTCK